MKLTNLIHLMFFIIFIVLIPSTLAVPLIPSGNILLKDKYGIDGAIYVNSTLYCDNSGNCANMSTLISSQGNTSQQMINAVNSTGLLINWNATGYIINWSKVIIDTNDTAKVNALINSNTTTNLRITTINNTLTLKITTVNSTINTRIDNLKLGNTSIEIIKAVNGTALNGTKFKSIQWNNIVGKVITWAEIISKPFTSLKTKWIYADGSGLLTINETTLNVTIKALDTNETIRVNALYSSNTTTNNRINTLQTGLSGNATKLNNLQVSFLSNVTKIDSSAFPGVCSANEVVQNTTNSGVQCIPRDEPSTTYYPTEFAIVFGTGTGGNNIGNISFFDLETFNVTEIGTGSTPLEVRINFTGVTSFDYVIMSEQYMGGQGHPVYVELYNYDLSIWKSFEQITDQGILVQSIFNVPNSANFISGGVVQIRFRHQEGGINSHYLYIDYINIIDGITTITTVDHDALSSRNNILINHPNIVDIFYTKTQIDNINNTINTRITNNYNTFISSNSSTNTRITNNHNSFLASNTSLNTKINAVNSSSVTNLNNFKTVVANDYFNLSQNEIVTGNTIFIPTSNTTFRNKVLMYGEVYLYNTTYLTDTQSYRVNDSIVLTDLGGTTKITLNASNLNNKIIVEGNVKATEVKANLNWTYLQNYPASCPADTFVTQMGDTITCTGLSKVGNTTTEMITAVNSTRFLRNWSYIDTNDSLKVIALYNSNTTTNSRIDTLQTGLSGNSTKLNNLQISFLSNVTKINTNAINIVALKNSNLSMNTRMLAMESSNLSQGLKLNALYSSNSTTNTRIDNLAIPTYSTFHNQKLNKTSAVVHKNLNITSGATNFRLYVDAGGNLIIG